MDTFDFWLRDPTFGREAKIYETLSESEAREILFPILKAKNVDSNTSQHSLEEEKNQDFVTQFSDQELERKSHLRNIQASRLRLMDSEAQFDELISIMDAAHDQIDSHKIIKIAKKEIPYFRLQYLEEPSKENELDKLEQAYTKNEYNCQRKHHHNPKTMSKIHELQCAELMEPIRPEEAIL